MLVFVALCSLGVATPFGFDPSFLPFSLSLPPLSAAKGRVSSHTPPFLTPILGCNIRWMWSVRVPVPASIT